MDAAEFDAMARAQATHWWYRALRGMVSDALTPHLPHAERPAILDAGCGTGANLPALTPLGTVVALDASRHALRHVNDVPAACADGRRLPLPGGAFDAVVSCDVLCHAAAGEPSAHLEEAYRVLKPGGVLVMNLPAYPWMYSAHDRAVANARRFERHEVVSMLEAAGLERMRVTHWNLLLMPAAAWLRRRERGGGASNLERPPSALQQAIGGAATSLERAWLRLAPLPAGLSILAVARKPRDTKGEKP